MKHGFLPGDELIRSSTGKVLYEVQSILPRIQSIKVLDVEEKKEILIEEAELRPQLVVGTLRLFRNGRDWGESLHRRSASDDASYSAAMQYLKAIDGIRTRYQVSFNKAHTILVEQAQSEPSNHVPPLISRATGYRLWYRDRRGIPLRLGDSTKGNRTQRYDKAVVDVIKDLARQHYLKPHSRWTLHSLTEFVNLRLHDADKLQPGKNLSLAYVRSVIKKELAADPGHRRMLPQDAISAKAVARRKIRIAGPFERVEQDGVHLPWLIRTPYGDSTNVWLVHAIDCATSVVLGWSLVIGSPRVTTTLSCIESILFPKARRWEDLGLAYDFDIYGTPLLLVLDNGPETRSERLLKLARLSIDINKLKARHAHHKPFIERLNRSLKEALDVLPGTTRMDGKDGSRDPAALGDDTMTLAEIERWIVRFYFEDWMHRRLERLEDSVLADNEDLGATPLLRYKTVTEKLDYPVPLPPSVEAWRSTVYDHEFRTLSRKTGISYGTYHFRGDRLAYLIGQFGETEVKVLIDPDDFRSVYVLDKDGHSLIPLVNTSASEVTPAYSFVEANEVLEQAREEGVESPEPGRFRRDIFDRSVGTSSAGGGKTKKTKTRPTPEASRETTKKARHHDAVLRAGQRPVPPPVGPSLGHPPLGTEEDDWSAVPALDVRDRKTGASRP